MTNDEVAEARKTLKRAFQDIVREGLQRVDPEPWRNDDTEAMIAMRSQLRECYTTFLALEKQLDKVDVWNLPTPRQDSLDPTYVQMR